MADVLYSKSELIKTVAEKCDSPKSVTGKYVDAVFDAIREMLVTGTSDKGETSISIQNFGVFSSKMSAARTGRNPHTGEEIEVPAGFRVAFKPSKNLKQAVRGK